MSAARLERFIAELSVVLEAERGRKAHLARFLDVRPHQVSEWLSGHNAPSAENLLGMIEWLKKNRPIRKVRN